MTRALTTDNIEMSKDVFSEEIVMCQADHDELLEHINTHHPIAGAPFKKKHRICGLSVYINNYTKKGEWYVT